jgi:DNA polymerase III alpha subunit
MSLPLFCFTDGSFEYGNNTAKENVVAAKAAGYDRVAIIDHSSMCNVIQFLKHCKAEDMGAIVGSTLSISIPERDRLVWAIENQNKWQWLFPHLALPTPSLTFAHQHCKTLVAALLAAKKSKAKAKMDTLTTVIANVKEQILADPEHTPAVPENAGDFAGLNEDFLKKTGARIMRWELDLAFGSLTFIAKSLKGYRSLLRLVSIRSLNKHHNIHNPDHEQKPLALTWEDIRTESEDVLVIDPLSSKSVLGAFSTARPSEREQLLSSLPLEDWGLDGLGLDVPVSRGAVTWLHELTRKHPALSLYPLPTASFTEKSLYEAYCIKVAVHRGVCVHDLLFQAPDPQKYIRQHQDVLQAYSDFECRDVDFKREHWDTFPNTDVPLNQIKLPNYKMAVCDVINYAFAQKSVSGVVHTDETEALSAFDDWIKPDCPENIAFPDFRQRRLNDFCLHQLSVDGVAKKVHELFGENADDKMTEYLDRHTMEYDVIEGMGFSGYFLIEYDFVSYARKIGVPVGDGRGSAAGSLIVYGLGITDVDPIAYDLQFERFLNPERVSMPDIDVDFGAGQGVDRGSVLKYISDSYQDPHSRYPSSSQIANMNCYQLKSSISAVRRCLGFTMAYDRYLKRLIEDVEAELGINTAVASVKWDELLETELIQNKLAKEPNLCRVLMFARTLTGKKSTYGVHAGGVVISPSIVPDYSAVECDDDGKFFSHFDKDDIETGGLIKFDVLGLKTLSVLDEAIMQIKRNHGIVIETRNLDTEDQEVYDLICRQVLSDVFQLESGGMRDLVGNLQPRSIGELAVLSALYRPGALDSGMVEDYIEVKGGKPVSYDHPALEVVTKETNGCIVYQEQVMSIVRELAGYSLGEADLLRRAMGKKKIEVMREQKSIYNGRAQGFWRPHYIKQGKPLKFPFELDVCLTDLTEELTHLRIVDCLDENGYFSNMDTVAICMRELLTLSDEALKKLIDRLSDMNYVVRLFKEDYFDAMTSSITHRLADFDEGRVKEVATRVYYALTQFVRFNQIFNKIEKFAGYGFNKSHAISYAMISYKTAYVKCHYPAEFYSAVLSFKTLDKLHATVVEATQKMGLKLLAPHVNKSKERFQADGFKSIRYGLGKLRDMGKSAALIVKEREDHGDYASLFEFLLRLKPSRKKPNAAAILSMSVSGAFDLFIPKRVVVAPQINGRFYIAWLRGLMNDSKAYKKAEPISGLHKMVDFMDEYEWLIYLTTLSTVKHLEKEKIVPSTHFPLLRSKVSMTGLAEQLDRVGDIASDSVVYNLVQRFKQDEALTPFDLEYLRAYLLFQYEQSFIAAWFASMKLTLDLSTTETLNAERHVSGMYITSTPIKVLNVADKVEREPPSSIIDGCPVELRQLDSGYNDQRVTTYGIARNVIVKNVKNEDSRYYNEKMLFFDLEHGADEVKCMIFGNAPTNAFYNKIIEDGAVMLVAGEVNCNDFGLTLMVQAVKRYYPIEDEKLQVVPKMKKR